jgi:hypothetical protein
MINIKNLLLLFVCFLSISLLAQKSSTSTKSLVAEDCAVKVIENCSTAPLIIFECRDGKILKCADKNKSFYKRFSNVNTFTTVQMSFYLRRGVNGDSPNSPKECQAPAKYCVYIKTK